MEFRLRFWRSDAFQPCLGHVCLPKGKVRASIVPSSVVHGWAERDRDTRGGVRICLGAFVPGREPKTKNKARSGPRVSCVEMICDGAGGRPGAPGQRAFLCPRSNIQ